MSLSSSPARERSLSPWSKLRAAAIESTGNESPTRAFHAFSPVSDTSSPRQARRSSPHSSDGSESEDVVAHPVGRIAARLAQRKAGSDSKAAISREPVKVSLHRKTASSRSSTPHASSKASSPERDASLRSRVSGRQLSTSPSPARNRQTVDESDASDAAIPQDRCNARFQELVAKKRAERKAKEEAEHAQRAEREALEPVRPSSSKDSSKRKRGGNTLHSDTEDENGKLMTQQSRPTRKAGKKAIEEMHRETQRMARNQHLTHDARVKAKVTTNQLFGLFGMPQTQFNSAPASPTKPSNLPAAQAQSSDAELEIPKDTPPTSPDPSSKTRLDYPLKQDCNKEDDCIIHTGADGHAVLSDDDELDLQALMQKSRNDKGKGKETTPTIIAPQPTEQPRSTILLPNVKKIKILPNTKIARNINLSDDDDDLQVESTKKPSVLSVFDNIPAKQGHESTAMIRIRALAGVKMSAPKPKDKSRSEHMSSLIEMQRKLQEQQRKQAMIEREERLQDMKARGIEVLTAEEREKEQLDAYNYLEKAREEAQELARKEKKAAKEDGEEGQHFDDSDDDDEDYIVGQAEDADADVELSGSEDEEEDDEADEANDDNERPEQPVIDDIAAESEDDAVAVEMNTPNARMQRKGPVRQRNVILEDDDDDEADSGAPLPASAIRTPGFLQKGQPFKDSPNEKLAAFGFVDPKTTPLALTQLFQSTMDDDMYSQMQSATPSHVQSLNFLKGFDSPIAAHTAVPDVLDSPTKRRGTQLATLLATQPLEHTMSRPTALLQRSASVALQTPAKSQFIEPTQDEGFQIDSTPIPLPIIPQSTVDTVIIPAAESEISLPRLKGRLRRRGSVLADFSDADEGDNAGKSLGAAENFELTTDAFEALFRGAQQPKKALADAYNKKQSRAKDMFAEQAEESEDEYAGLGGASDEESDHEFDEDLEDLIDENKVDVKETALAQLYADKERADDEKQVDKLFRDITTGGLRRKRNAADMDNLSDSEDEAAERRRRKQLEFARMRKALLEDEDLGKIAENPKRMAFLRAIEDHDEDADYADFLGESMETVASVPDSQDPTLGQSQMADPLPVDEHSEIPAIESQIDAAKQPVVPSMAHRRTAMPDTTTKKARTLAEIKESVSCLLDEPFIPDSQIEAESDDNDSTPGSDAELEFDDADESQNANDSQRSARALREARASIVNRLHNTSQDSLSTSQYSGQPQAFFANANTSQDSLFKVPSLLRRATTNMSTMSTGSNSGANTPTGNSQSSNKENAGGVRRGGSKKSNIHYQAREAERRKIVDKAGLKRKADVKRRVKGLANVGKKSLIGMLGGGGFE